MLNDRTGGQSAGAPMSKRTVSEKKGGASKKPRQLIRPFRTTKFMEERSSLLRCLLQDARLQRCIQLVP
jgi:hypothetical protein